MTLPITRWLLVEIRDHFAPPPCLGATAAPEPLLTANDLVARAHARGQGVSYETGEQWLARLSERLRPTPALAQRQQAECGLSGGSRRPPLQQDQSPRGEPAPQRGEELGSPAGAHK